MKNKVICSSLLIGLLASSIGTVFATEVEDAEKLQMLEKSMQPKRKTRAIVYDTDQNKNEESGSDKQAANVGDCTKISADANGTKIDFAIQFKMGRSDIATSSEYTLQEIAKVLKLNPDRCIFVEGHTDAVGNVSANMALSKERAESVVNFIVGKNGMDKNRFIATGKGSTEPLKNLAFSLIDKILVLDDCNW